MNKTCATLAATLAVGFSAGVLADPPAEVMNITRSDDVKFMPSSIVPGVASAVISGDPKVPGQPYVVRNRFSPNTFSPPHFHPETRYIVVLKGTWYVGTGTDWDKSKTTPVPAGSFVVHHPNKIHWDGAKDEEVILQIMGVGPSATIRVDESGQPKK
jgi:quercetin dioxygenase-like cupin family protein